MGCNWYFNFESKSNNKMLLTFIFYFFFQKNSFNVRVVIFVRIVSSFLDTW